MDDSNRKLVTLFVEGDGSGALSGRSHKNYRRMGNVDQADEITEKKKMFVFFILNSSINQNETKKMQILLK